MGDTTNSFPKMVKSFVELLSIASCKKIGLDLKAQDILAAKNDGGISFKNIAKWIDKNL